MKRKFLEEYCKQLGLGLDRKHLSYLRELHKASHGGLASRADKFGTCRANTLSPGVSNRIAWAKMHLKPE